MDEDDAMRDQFQAYVDERKEADVALAKSVSAIEVRDRTLTVTLDPDAAGITAETALAGYDEDFVSRFFALPAIGPGDNQTALSERLDRVEVFLADGSPVASVAVTDLQRGPQD